MIKLFGFGESFGVADSSPFVLKVNVYLKMSGIDFKSSSGFSAFKNAPKGKLPYIDDDGEIIADSFFILRHLQKKYGSSLDGDLTDEQKAMSKLIIKSLEENFYWCIVYSRWLRSDTWPTIKNAFFGTMPFPLNYIIPIVARRGVKSAFIKHGMGKHSDTEIMEIAEDTLGSLSVMLSDKTYFFGDDPSTLDAVVYAFLAQVTLADIDNPLNRLARKFDNLLSYCERINAKYYGNENNS